MSTKSAVINDRHIICPHCQNDVTVLRPHGGGAAYAKKWRKLPKRALAILRVWCENPVYSNYWLSKDTLQAICDNENLNMKFASVNARVSELVALGLVQVSRHERVDHTTTRKPLYKINTDNARLVLAKNGVLKDLEVIS